MNDLDAIKEVLREQSAVNRDLLDTIRRLQYESVAYRAATHSLIQNHVNLEQLADDYMIRRDNYAMSLTPENSKHVSPAWGQILHSMTEELNRRRSSPGG